MVARDIRLKKNILEILGNSNARFSKTKEKEKTQSGKPKKERKPKKEKKKEEERKRKKSMKNYCSRCGKSFSWNDKEFSIEQDNHSSLVCEDCYQKINSSEEPEQVNPEELMSQQECDIRIIRDNTNQIARDLEFFKVLALLSIGLSAVFAMAGLL